jgi:transketolase
MLLDPFEEQLNLPALLVDLRDGQSGQREVIESSVMLFHDDNAGGGEAMVSTSSSVVRDLKKDILLCAYHAKEGHIASAFSIIDIIWVLYNDLLKYDCREPKWEGRDRFILSKGHGCLALYAVLAKKQFFPADVLDTFAQYDSPLGGHPDRNKVPGIEASTGSLGHGFPMAVGIALALRLKKNDRLVYCLIGDGECNEGSIWESCLLASQYGLGSLCCIVDFNHSTDRALDLGNLKAKFSSMGFETAVVDGHDHQALARSLGLGPWQKPRAVIACTVKGKGCAEMESNPAWHHRIPSEDELEYMMRELY